MSHQTRSLPDLWLLIGGSWRSTAHACEASSVPWLEFNAGAFDKALAAGSSSSRRKLSYHSSAPAFWPKRGMSFEPRDYLRHMVLEADYLIGQTPGLSFEAFVADGTHCRAFVRSLGDHW